MSVATPKPPSVHGPLPGPRTAPTPCPHPRGPCVGLWSRARTRRPVHCSPRRRRPGALGAEPGSPVPLAGVLGRAFGCRPWKHLEASGTRAQGPAEASVHTVTLDKSQKLPCSSHSCDSVSQEVTEEAGNWQEPAWPPTSAGGPGRRGPRPPGSGLEAAPSTHQPEGRSLAEEERQRRQK